jgi:hypothetical protein
MEHVVFHPGPDGAPAFRRFSSLEDAVHFVEHLRNVEGVIEVSVHALTPVPLAFRAYYKVEMPVEPVDAALPVDPVAASFAESFAAPVPGLVAEPVGEPEVVAEPVAQVPAPAVPVDPVAEPEFAAATAAAEQPSNGKRSLGFFAH